MKIARLYLNISATLFCKALGSTKGPDVVKPDNLPPKVKPAVSVKPLHVKAWKHLTALAPEAGRHLDEGADDKPEAEEPENLPPVKKRLARAAYENVEPVKPLRLRTPKPLTDLGGGEGAGEVTLTPMVKKPVTTLTPEAGIHLDEGEAGEMPLLEPLPLADLGGDGGPEDVKPDKLPPGKKRPARAAYENWETVPTLARELWPDLPDKEYDEMLREARREQVERNVRKMQEIIKDFFTMVEKYTLPQKDVSREPICRWRIDWGLFEDLKIYDKKLYFRGLSYNVKAPFQISINFKGRTNALNLYCPALLPHNEFKKLIRDVIESENFKGTELYMELYQLKVFAEEGKLVVLKAEEGEEGPTGPQTLLPLFEVFNPVTAMDALILGAGRTLKIENWKVKSEEKVGFNYVASKVVFIDPAIEDPKKARFVLDCYACITSEKRNTDAIHLINYVDSFSDFEFPNRPGSKSLILRIKPKSLDAEKLDTLQHFFTMLKLEKIAIGPIEVTTVAASDSTPSAPYLRGVIVTSAREGKGHLILVGKNGFGTAQFRLKKGSTRLLDVFKENPFYDLGDQYPCEFEDEHQVCKFGAAVIKMLEVET